MSHISTEPWFEDVYQIERHDIIKGGAGGTANRQAKALANRDRFLKTEMDKGHWAMIGVQANVLALTAQQAHLQLQPLLN